LEPIAVAVEQFEADLTLHVVERGVQRRMSATETIGGGLERAFSDDGVKNTELGERQRVHGCDLQCLYKLCKFLCRDLELLSPTTPTQERQSDSRDFTSDWRGPAMNTSSSIRFEITQATARCNRIPPLCPWEAPAVSGGLGKNEPFFLPLGAEAFRRDDPNAITPARYGTLCAKRIRPRSRRKCARSSADGWLSASHFNRCDKQASPCGQL